MKKDYLIKQMAETRWFYKFLETNSKGEKLLIELSLCTNSGSSHSLPILWKQNGFIDRVLETYWCIETYATDTEGACWGRYNPQSKLSEDGKRAVINFDWMFEATEENKEKLIDEVYKQWSIAKGETATEIKHKKVREYAEQNNLEVFTEMPQGWYKLESMTAPLGSIRVSNMRLSINTFRDKNRKEALVLI